MTIFDDQMRFEDYDGFIEKFKPRKTTDDCYTPQNVFDVIAKWACDKYGFSTSQIVRPFYPGGDYLRFDYPDNCIVLDNPPFSILGEIENFYLRHNVAFFLFAPGLLMMKPDRRLHYVLSGSSIMFENGAEVNCGFVTNLGEYIMESAPELGELIRRENDKNRKEKKKNIANITLPDEIVTTSLVGRFARYGVEYRLKESDCIFIRKLDCGYNIYGSGQLLSKKATAERREAERREAERREAERREAERREAERREAERIHLSGREISITEMLDA